MTTALLLLGMACFPASYTNNSGHDSAAESGGADSDTGSGDVDTDTDTDSDTDTDTAGDTDTDTAVDTDTGGTDTGSDTGTDTGGGSGDTSFAVGEVWVSEFLANSHPIDDGVGEWIELRSLAGRDLDLKGLSIGDLDPTSPQSVTIDKSVILPALGYVVIGNSTDKTKNGGVDVAWAWDATAFQLGNDGDEIVLSKGATTFDSVAYEETAWAMVKGVSVQRDEDHYTASASSDPAFWCAGTSTFGPDAQVGTPGAANDDCGK